MRASELRNINRQKSRETVFASYRIALPVPVDAYELDHLIPLELGGSDAIENLWPQAAVPSPGFHEKDKVEIYLKQRVCTGKMSLAEAQRSIATNWIQVYKDMH